MNAVNWKSANKLSLYEQYAFNGYSFVSNDKCVTWSINNGNPAIQPGKNPHGDNDDDGDDSDDFGLVLFALSFWFLLF
jgi:hypothetical protein